MVLVFRHSRCRYLTTEWLVRPTPAYGVCNLAGSAAR
jgi:hypothetical protein